MAVSSETIILDMDVVIKSSSGENGKRLVSVEASNEAVDSEGDCILQKALMDSSDYFIKNGHFDIDHYSELGLRLGITNPSQYIIGYPSKVVDLGKGRTGVEGEIMKNANGTFDPTKYVYDQFWASLQTDPPTKWRASIYGKASEIDSSGKIAPRHVVKAIEWKSLAFTRRPVNKEIQGEAKIITAKAYVDMVKTEMLAPIGPIYGTSSRQLLLDTYNGHICHSCPATAEGKFINFYSIREHFERCENMPYGAADLATLALAHLIQMHSD